MPAQPVTGAPAVGSRARRVALALIVAVAACLLTTAVTACGQRGPLFLPDANQPDKRR